MVAWETRYRWDVCENVKTHMQFHGHKTMRPQPLTTHSLVHKSTFIITDWCWWTSTGPSSPHTRQAPPQQYQNQVIVSLQEGGRTTKMQPRETTDIPGAGTAWMEGSPEAAENPMRTLDCLLVVWIFFTAPNYAHSEWRRGKHLPSHARKRGNAHPTGPRNLLDRLSGGGRRVQHLQPLP